MLQLSDVRKVFDDGFVAVDDVSFAAARGELVVILGESGCGKTTTLKMINRLIEPTAGEIVVDGADIRGRDPVQLRRSIGYVFQVVGLLQHMTIAEVSRLFELVNWPAEQFATRMPSELSGGQLQRVGFARALASDPQIMLLDEPFGALDPLTRDSLQSEFKQIQKDLELTAILVTHDMNEALLLADRIIVMREGRIVQDGAPHALIADPADDYVDSLMSTPRRQAARLDDLQRASA